MITEHAPAKLNLALHVRHRRADGYHELETLFAFCRDGDLVSIAKAEADSFAIEGPFATGLCTGANNLVLRAARAFTQAFAVSQRHAITLTKNLPVASGVGGGSADAAATLRALAQLHNVAPDEAQLVRLAAQLGADVPACLAGRTALGTGRGDALVPVAGLAKTPVLLVNPGVAVSTGAVFAGWDGIDRGGIPDGGLLTRARAARNDLETSALALAPVIADVRAELDAAPGALLSRMSGSGATCFALFDDEANCARTAVVARAKGWWCLESALV